MGATAPSWHPDYSPALMRRELEIIEADLHASAVRLGGRDPRPVLEAAEYAASIGLHVWVGPELWNATPGRTLRHSTEAAALAEPLRSTADRSLTAHCRSSASSETTSTLSPSTTTASPAKTSPMTCTWRRSHG
jgi:hypothetical protein